MYSLIFNNVYLEKTSSKWIFKWSHNQEKLAHMFYIYHNLTMFSSFPCFMSFFTPASAQNFQTENFDCANKFALENLGRPTPRFLIFLLLFVRLSVSLLVCPSPLVEVYSLRNHYTLYPNIFFFTNISYRFLPKNWEIFGILYVFNPLQCDDH